METPNTDKENLNTEKATRLVQLLNVPLSQCQIALERTDNDEERATDYLLSNEDKPDSFWDDHQPHLPPALFEFERWGEALELVDEERLSEILSNCISTGQVFSDPSFPASDSSLFLDPESARTQWRCHDCNKTNPMPPEEQLEQYRKLNPTRTELRQFFEFIARTNPAMASALHATPQSAVQMMAASFGGGSTASPSPLTCAFCTGTFPLGVLEAKPSQWLRPKDIRDEVTLQYGAGAPWKVVRDEVRADDVRQGAVGNCWFVGSLSILAHQRPELVRNGLFPVFGSEASEFGVYMLRLCKDGVWRNVIIDDSLPCNRHATLAYTTAARRQLWVPLIEKAAAKLFSCYEGMHSGTLCEAFSLLTGFATNRVLSDKDVDSDELWALIESAHSSRFLIGLACTAKPPETTQAELQALGLQAPHAYIVLNTKELPNGTKLLYLGNPWGERSPSTWTGKWGNASSELKEAVRVGLLPKHAHDVVSNGEFWIQWEEVRRVFTSIEFCRTASEDLKSDMRLRGWLLAATGLGDSFQFSTTDSPNGKVRLDLSLYQESHAVRESAQGGQSTNVDLGFVLAELNQHGRLGKVLTVQERKFQPEVSCEVLLDSNSQFILIPISFGNSAVPEHRKVCACLRTTEVGLIHKFCKLPNDPMILTEAVHAYCDFLPSTTKMLFPGFLYSVTKDAAGAIVRGENQTTCIYIHVTADAEDSTNLVNTRPGSHGGLLTTDMVPPKTKMVLMALTPKRGASRYGMAITVAATRHAVPTDPPHFPPLTDDEPIACIHRPCLIEGRRIVQFSELVRLTSDPVGNTVIMHLLMTKERETQRLYHAYIEAGLSVEDATRIAQEETQGLYS